ncbi:MAG TPA: substrate-binding domain-containing protein [Anaeromyxobacter sp.]|nr:substrate-binding domain-containing protein [Anaeromyxobacter sp.]
MQALLEDVRSLPGVVGSMFCDRRRGLLARAFPREYDDASLQAVAAALAASVPRLAELTGPVGVVDLRYRDARVVIRPEGDAALLVLCDRTANAQEVLGFAAAVCTMLVRRAAASTGELPLPVPALARLSEPAPASSLSPRIQPAAPAPVPAAAATAPGTGGAPEPRYTSGPVSPPVAPPEFPEFIEVPLEVTLPPTPLARASGDEPRWAQGPLPAVPPSPTERGDALLFDRRRRRRPVGALVTLAVMVVAAGYGVAHYTGAMRGQRQSSAASSAAAPAQPPRHVPTPSPIQWRLRLSGAEALAAELAPSLASAFLAAQGTAEVHVSSPAPEVAQVRGLADGGAVGIEIRASDTAQGLDDLLAGIADVAMATRRPTPEEQQRLLPLGHMTSRECEHVLGVDGIAVIVHRANPIASLTREQLGRILSGTVTDWARFRVAGEAAKAGIHVYLPDDRSGVPEAAQTTVLGGKALTLDARRLPTPRAVADAVSTDPGAVGLVPIADVAGARAVPLGDGVGPPGLPTALTVASERYPLTRRLYLYAAQSSSNPSVAKFLEFALSAQGQALVRKAGFVELGGGAPVPAAPRAAATPAPGPARAARTEAPPAAPDRASAAPAGPSPALAAALASIPAVPPPKPAPSASPAPAAAPAPIAAPEPPDVASAGPDAVAAAPELAPPLPQRPMQPVAEDSIVVASKAAQRPRVMELGCVERSIRVPQDTLPYVAGMVVTVRFAVGKDGMPSQYQMTTPGMPESASYALWAAIQSCRWQPGIDETGRPASMWVVMPFQFARE